MFSSIGCPPALAAPAGAADIKVTLDWAFGGPKSPFVLAQQRGYFAAEGLNVTIDRGEGSGAVPPKVAAGNWATRKMDFAAGG